MAEGILSRGLCNPVIRKMRKKTDLLAGASPRVATYSGIAKKTAFFLGLTILGVVIYYVLHPFLIEHLGKGQMFDALDESGIFHFNFAMYELIAFTVTTVISLFFPLLAWFIRPLIPVVGSIYALSQGYMIGFLTGNLMEQFRWIGAAAFGITFVLVSVMLILYTTGIAKPSKKVLGFASSAFLTSLLVSGIGFVLNLIPFTRPLVAPILSFFRNPYISIGVSVVYILIATFFLLVDFDTIESCVEDRMPRKLEWMAAWGLAYTIIYLYLKIFNVLLKIFSRKKE